MRVVQLCNIPCHLSVASLPRPSMVIILAHGHLSIGSILTL